MIRNFLLFCIATIILSLAGLCPQECVAAQEKQPQDPCTNAQTTVVMRDCAGKEYKEADAKLNKTYNQAMAKLDDKGHKAALKNAQLAWIKYRDANCEATSYINKGGTIYPVVYTGCLSQMTAQRTKELQEMLKEN